jgi:hypothetical protein
MKSTKLMLAVIATFVLTAMFFGLIGYMLSDLTYKQCMQHGALWFGMLIVGWIPSVVVAIDLEEHA